MISTEDGSMREPLLEAANNFQDHGDGDRDRQHHGSGGPFVIVLAEGVDGDTGRVERGRPGEDEVEGGAAAATTEDGARRGGGGGPRSIDPLSPVEMASPHEEAENDRDDNPLAPLGVVAPKVLVRLGQWLWTCIVLNVVGTLYWYDDGDILWLTTMSLLGHAVLLGILWRTVGYQGLRYLDLLPAIIWPLVRLLGDEELASTLSQITVFVLAPSMLLGLLYLLFEGTMRFLKHRGRWDCFHRMEEEFFSRGVEAASDEEEREREAVRLEAQREAFEPGPEVMARNHRARAETTWRMSFRFYVGVAILIAVRLLIEIPLL